MPRPKLVLGVLVAAVALAGAWMWFRDSSLVAANRVTITGVHGPQAGVIRQALADAAGEMTTLDVKQGKLQAAVRDYPLVQSVTASAGFPHKLRISVQEHTAVAAVVLDGRAIPVAEDGTILRGAFVAGLTPLRVRTPPVGAKLTDPFALAATHILAAAPEAMRRRVTRVFMGPRGLTARLSGAPTVVFGSGRRGKAKWVSLQTLLASGKVAGATTIDVSVPERPAVLGLAAPAQVVADPASVAVPPGGATTTALSPPAPTSAQPATTTQPQTGQTAATGGTPSTVQTSATAGTP